MRGGELVAVRRTFDSNVSLRSRDAGARVLVTPLGAVVAECVSTVGLVDAVVLADAVRARGVSVADELPPGRSNARQRADLRRVVALSDAGAESAMESRTRLLLTLVGLRGMVSQHVIVTGGRTWRIDLAFPDRRVAIEYDGRSCTALAGSRCASRRCVAAALPAAGGECGVKPAQQREVRMWRFGRRAPDV